MLPLIALSTLASAQDTTEDFEVEFEELEQEVEADFFHGFRMGYTYIQNYRPSPHMYVFGYELTQRIGGGSWLDVILVENLMLSGLNQSVVIPSFNFLVGFEIDDRLQFGAGPNLIPFAPEGQGVHMIVAVGYTVTAGALNMPFHLSVIPDVQGNNRLALTTGVNWR